MRILFFDTETTGLPLWHEPSDSPDQPHIVELACELWQAGEQIDGVDTLVIPGIEIPEDVIAIHGITNEMAAGGISKRAAIDTFLDFASRADLVVGHEVNFDVRMIRIEHSRTHGEKWECTLPKFCTSGKTMGRVRVYQADGKRLKKPTLTEAVRHFFGEDFTEAHRAGPDCAASRRIYFHVAEPVLA